MAGRHPVPRSPMNTRRQFLIAAPVGALGAAIACRAQEQGKAPAPGSAATPGAPPTFASAPASGPAVSPSTFAEAEKLAQVTMTAPEREMAAATWPRSMAPLFERRVGPRKVSLPADLPPATRWNPLIGGGVPQTGGTFVRTRGQAIPVPANDADIAFAPVTQLSRWIEAKALTSERLTNIYLRRIEQFDPKL